MVASCESFECFERAIEEVEASFNCEAEPAAEQEDCEARKQKTLDKLFAKCEADALL